MMNRGSKRELNDVLFHYYVKEHIIFTRSRSY